MKQTTFGDIEIGIARILNDPPIGAYDQTR